MAFLQVSLSKTRYKNSTLEYLVESDLIHQYRVINNKENSSKFEIYKDDKLISIVGVASYFWHSEFDFKVVYPNRWEGWPKGMIDLNDNNEVFINDNKVAKIESSGESVCQWIKTMIKQRRLYLLVQWQTIRFDERKLDVDIALSLLLLNFTRLHS